MKKRTKSQLNSVIYPTDMDIYGFHPIEKEYRAGDMITDKRTGLIGYAVMRGDRCCANVDRCNFEIVNDSEK